MSDKTGILMEDIRFGMGDNTKLSSNQKYSPQFLSRRINHAINLFNLQNDFSYTVDLLDEKYYDFIILLVQILLCKWEATRNAKKFPIKLDKLEVGINKRVEQYLSVSKALLDEYNLLANQTDNISSIDETGELPLVDMSQGTIILFDEDYVQSTADNKKSIFISDNNFPDSDGITVITLTFKPKDIMGNNMGYGLNVEIVISGTSLGSWVGSVSDKNDGTYKRKFMVSNTPERVFFVAKIEGVIISNLKVNVGSV